MIKKIIYTLLVLVMAVPSAFAQELPEAREELPDPFAENKYTDEYLDTVDVRNVFLINDYSMFGFEYGASYARQLFSHKFTQQSILLPGYCGISYTRYSKMFGYMPYFGLKIGLMKGYEGFKFVPSDTGYQHDINGAEEVIVQLYELPMLTQFHYDMEHFKLFCNLGIYGSYRSSIEKTGPGVNPDFRYTFAEPEGKGYYHLDYGLMGGPGFGIVVAPFEFLVGGLVRWSWNYMYDPSSDILNGSNASPFDIIVTAGLHIHLTKRTGRTRASFRQEAKSIVYGEDNSK